MKPRYWTGDIGKLDDFDDEITDEFIDGQTHAMIDGQTPAMRWAIMTPRNWATYGIGKLGTGYGQRYKKTPEGWLKVEG